MKKSKIKIKNLEKIQKRKESKNLETIKKSENIKKSRK